MSADRQKASRQRSGPHTPQRPNQPGSQKVSSHQETEVARNIQHAATRGLPLPASAVSRRTSPEEDDVPSIQWSPVMTPVTVRVLETPRIQLPFWVTAERPDPWPMHSEPHRSLGLPLSPPPSSPHVDQLASVSTIKTSPSDSHATSFVPPVTPTPTSMARRKRNKRKSKVQGGNIDQRKQLPLGQGRPMSPPATQILTPPVPTSPNPSLRSASSSLGPHASSQLEPLDPSLPLPPLHDRRKGTSGVTPSAALTVRDDWRCPSMGIDLEPPCIDAMDADLDHANGAVAHPPASVRPSHQPEALRSSSEDSTVLGGHRPSSVTETLHADADPHDSEPVVPLLFAPISAEGGLGACCERIAEMKQRVDYLAGATIFLGSPKRTVVVQQATSGRRSIDELLALSQELQIMAHANHTTNFASQNEVVWRASLASLVVEMKRARDLGIKLLVIHLGNTGLEDPAKHKAAMKVLAERLGPAVDQVPEVTLAVETMTGRCKGESSRSISSIRKFIKRVDRPGRIKVCIDLCHVYLCHDLTTDEGKRKFFRAVDRLGKDSVAAVHVSDSLEKHGSKEDRHANVEFGYMGVDTLRDVLRHPSMRNLPTILETPAYSRDTRDGKSRLATLIWQLERQRTALELDLLRDAITATDDEWKESEGRVVGKYLEDKRKIEKRILRLEHKLKNAETQASQDHRKSINGKLVAAARERNKRRQRVLRPCRPLPAVVTSNAAALTSTPAAVVTSRQPLRSPIKTRLETLPRRSEEAGLAAAKQREGARRLSVYEDPAYYGCFSPPLAASPRMFESPPAFENPSLSSNKGQSDAHLDSGSSSTPSASLEATPCTPVQACRSADPFGRTFHQTDMTAGPSTVSQGILDFPIVVVGSAKAKRTSSSKRKRKERRDEGRISTKRSKRSSDF